MAMSENSVFYTEISDVLRCFRAVHKDVLIKYLTLRFDALPTSVESALHKAVLSRACYELEGGFYGESPSIKVDSHTRDMSRAFSVALEFMEYEETNFITSRMTKGNSSSNLLSVIIPAAEDSEVKQSHIVQISSIHSGSELAMSQSLATTPIPENIKEIITRIGVVDDSFQQEYMLKTGFIMYVKFSSNKYTFNQNNIIHADIDTRWDDVKNG